MRNIVFTRGAAGVGKSTFLKEKGLLEYTISPDNLRLFFESPQVNIKGEWQISQKNEKRVWELLLKVVNERMQKGEFIIIDATHTRENDFDKYKKLIEENRYHGYVLDFSDLSLEETLKRNNERTYKKVPENIVEDMYERSVKNKIPSWLSKIEKEEFEKWLTVKPLDFSNYKKIHHIGDLQGCFTVLEKYFSESGGIKEDELYIFVGDYIDRGIENAKVVNWCLENTERKNFIFMEGNHDIYLWEWANDKEVKINEFTEFTKKELEENNIDKKKLRNFCRRLCNFAYYIYNDKKVFVSHGGVSKIPSENNIKLISSDQYIKGYGQYREYLDVSELFLQNYKNEQIYSIHGHRNNYHYPTKINNNVFNLEGKVEFGEFLRVVTLDKNGFEIKEVKNDIFKEVLPYRIKNKVPVNFHNMQIVDKLRENKFIKERNFEGNISSFNFTREVFYEKIWNRETIKARGLFINTNNFEIVARSYEKFFNINERDETKVEILADNFKYPVSVYVKENGYLGILGYDEEMDKLIYTSKASLDNDFAKWFENIFVNSFGENFSEIKIKLKKYLKQEKVSLVFEVIDPIKDPHIIKYNKAKIVLLDVIKRDFDFSKYNYEKLKTFANEFGFEVKKIFKVLENKNEFLEFYNLENSRSYEEEYFEGFVLEDSFGFMTKLKLNYYIFWKGVRDYLKNLKENENAKPRKDIAGKEVFIEFEKFRKSEIEKDDNFVNKSMIEMRDLFLNFKNGIIIK